MTVGELLSLGRHWQSIPSLYTNSRKRLAIVGILRYKDLKKIHIIVSCADLDLACYEMNYDDVYQLLRHDEYQDFEINCELIDEAGKSRSSTQLQQVGHSRNICVYF